MFQILGAVIMVVAIGIPLVAWRISSGPISLDWLSPYIEEALSDDAMRVRLERTVLAWDSEARLLEVRAQEVRAIVAGQTIASVPELSLSFRGRPLLKGDISPSALRLIRPRLVVIRGQDGTIELGLGDEGAGDRRDLIDRLWRKVTDPAPNSAEADLRSIAIVDADLTFEDRATGTRWNFPDVDLNLARDGGEVTIDAGISATLGKDAAALTARTRLNASLRSLPVAFEVKDFRPSSLAPLLPEQPIVKMLDMPLTGTGQLTVRLDGTIEEVALNVQSAPGIIRLDGPFVGAHPIASGRLVAKGSDNLRQLSIEELRLDLGGPVLTATAKAEPRGEGLAVTGQASVNEMPVARLKDLWPADLAPNPRRWIVANITEGMVRRVQAGFSAQSTAPGLAALRFDSILCQLDVQDATVQYFRPMPLATGARGQVTIDQHKLVVRIASARSGGLTISEGSVVIDGIDKQAVQKADIQLKVSGSVADALRLLDSKPLSYASKLGLKPETLGGTQVTTLNIVVPLLHDVTLDSVKVSAEADLVRLVFPKVLQTLDLTEGNLHVRVDTKSLEAAGNAQIGGIPARLKWTENFSGQGAKRVYQVSTQLDDKERAILGLAETTQPFLGGPVGVEATIAYGEGDRATLDARLDLSRAGVEMPYAGWRKEPGRPGSASVKGILDKNGLLAVPDFSARADDLSLQGMVAMADGRVRRIEFSKLVFGRNDLTATIRLDPDGGAAATFAGKSLDAVPLLKEAKDDGQRDETLPPLTLSGQVERLWVSSAGALSRASVNLRRERGDWREAKLEAFAGQKPLHVQVQPLANGTRRLTATSEDAGSVLKTFGIYDHMHGGRLDVRGTFEDGKPGRPLAGKASIQNYSITEAPVLARLLTILALTGILDVLRGEGISFASFEAPFTFRNGLLEVKDALAYGAALGITANGQADFDHDKVAMEGTIVPAYALNSLIGNIPLIGRLFTGDKGSGIFAATYTVSGPLADPDVSVNPLATLAPGFLRKFFQIFTPDATKARPNAGGEANQAPAPAGPGRVD